MSDGVRFRRELPDVLCGKTVEGPPYADAFGGLACSREADHAPPCIAMMGDAAHADGRCWSCFAKRPRPHFADCWLMTTRPANVSGHRRLRRKGGRYAGIHPLGRYAIRVFLPQQPATHPVQPSDGKGEGERNG